MSSSRRRLVILGSTGSIGRNTLDVVQGLGDCFDVVGIAAGSNWEVLAGQARQWRPEFVALADARHAAALAGAVGTGVNVLAGAHALVELIDRARCDFVVSAVVGVAGIPATYRAVELGKTVALANKEALVVAGAVIIPLARRSGATLLPIDSEHSAIFQALHAGHRGDVRRILLTTSGGPFRTWTREQIAAATVDEALRHPTWNMGPKITLDSATMMNKALEIIEACWLFGVDEERIDVVVHPEAVVHSMVEFCDGSVIAQMGTPDMRTPIQYALTYPRRRRCPSPTLDLFALERLSFHPPDPERFPALDIGRRAARAGGNAGAVFNAANEVAVDLFRAGEIGCSDVPAITGEVLGRRPVQDDPSLDDLLAADRWAREEAKRCLTS